MKFIIIFLLIFLYSTIIIAEQKKEQFAYIDSVTGVQIKLLDNGNVKEMYSIGEADLAEIDNEAAIQAAFKIAAIRAKAAIVQFIKQRINSNDVVTSLIKSHAYTDNNGHRQVSTEAIEMQRSTITISADEILKELVTLSQKINYAEHKVIVSLGFNQVKTVGEQHSLEDAIQSLTGYDALKILVFKNTRYLVSISSSEFTSHQASDRVNAIKIAKHDSKANLSQFLNSEAINIREKLASIQIVKTMNNKAELVKNETLYEQLIINKSSGIVNDFKTLKWRVDNRYYIATIFEY